MTTASIVKAIVVWTAIALLARRSARAHHPFPRLGPANYVTMVRAFLVAFVAGFVGEASLPGTAQVVAGAAVIATALDGVDGWLARRTGMASAFGARFDMEIDALLIQVLAILAWQYNKAGAWVLASGLLRYVFVAAGWVLPWMQEPLFPSFRRKTICVVQIVGLILTMVPSIVPPASEWLAAVSLAALAYSFLVDTLWLWRHAPYQVRRLEHGSWPVAEGLPQSHQRSATSHDSGSPVIRSIVLVAALVLLDASVTFENVWPTPAIDWRGALSIELAVCLLGMAIVSRRFGPPSRAAIAWLSAIWTVLVLGHYAEVTAPALYGRDINLYWDLRFIPDVAAMVARVASWWLIVLSASATVLILAMLHALLRLAWRRVAESMRDDNQRGALIALSLAAVALFIGRPAKAEVPGEDTVHTFGAPVIRTYARQLMFVAEALTGSRTLADSPPMSSDLSGVQGADVYVVFVESYGAVSFDRPALAPPIAAARSQLDAAIRETRRQVVSAFVESPTFGGSSWLAHISLLSGIEVRDPDTNARLMAARRDTLAKAFGRRGFRTVALMPGLRQSWPEGVFYGFDEIYGADRLDYRGPEFGWFAVPDEYSLARFDALEAARGSAGQRFVFFPTISTHFPFRPTPPYQPDWPRMLTHRPYDGPEIVRAYAHQPDWTDFGPGYVEAMTYDLDVLAGYLSGHADRDLVMIVLGDHQPPAAVSGERASWDVPVHVITGRAAVLDRLRSNGFSTGLTPARHRIGRMHELLPKLLDAFGDLATDPR